MFLIIGCGYIGERVADLLHAAGHDVVGVTHSPESAGRLSQIKPYAVIAGDVSDAASVKQLADRFDVSPAVVIHCASSGRGGAAMYRQVYLEGCRHLLSDFPEAFLLFTSSTSVYPQTDGSIVTEECDATPDRETSRILRETEDLVIAHQGCVVRLAGIYGPSRSFVLKNFLEGAAAIEGNNGDGRCLNQIHREDAANALVHLAVKRRAGIFNVVDDTPMTQRECFEQLAEKFDKPMPPITEPDTSRKRAWTHKHVSNARLRATGWTPLYPSYFDALAHDPILLPSILAQVSEPRTENREPQRGMNIVLVGLMGSGKSTVGRITAQNLGFGFVDTDQIIIEAAGRSIPDIFASEGEAGFRKREAEALQSLLGRQGLVIATGGGIVTQTQNLAILKKLGYVVWLNADPGTLHHRTARSDDRPLLKQGDPAETLRKLYEARRARYAQVCDLKITTDNLSAHDVAYGVSESARVHFSQTQVTPN